MQSPLGKLLHPFILPFICLPGTSVTSCHGISTLRAQEMVRSSLKPNWGQVLCPNALPSSSPAAAVPSQKLKFNVLLIEQGNVWHFQMLFWKVQLTMCFVLYQAWLKFKDSELSQCRQPLFQSKRKRQGERSWEIDLMPKSNLFSCSCGADAGIWCIWDGTGCWISWERCGIQTINIIKGS